MSENKCCGNCKHFQNESATGNGWCNENDWISNVDKVCKCHEDIDNGWTEITPDNVYDVCEKRGNIAFMNPTRCCHATVWHNVEREILELYAIRGGYYYYVIPELKIE